MENYENNLFKAADKLRGKIPPSDYKYYVLPLVFMRYMSEKNKSHTWEEIVDLCDSHIIMARLDEELVKIFPKSDMIYNPFEGIYLKSNLSGQTIKELVHLIHEIDLINQKEKIDYLGRIYEYFISNFAATEGKRGGEFFTPASVVELLVQMLNPQEGIVYDPACGTGGMFIQSNKYSGKKLKFVGQEQNCKTIMLAYMNGVLHGLDLEIRSGDTLLHDCFDGLKADYVISNPPFNMKDWGAEQLPPDDFRIFGKINKNNANYMWIQHFIYHMKKTGKAGFVISNGALTSSNEADLYTRTKMLEQNMIDCIVQLPDKMFSGTAIPSALIFLDKSRDKKARILFIDAGDAGESISKTQKVLKEDDIADICKLYHSFRAGEEIEYNVKGHSWAVSVDEVFKHECKLMPSIYTGIEEKKIDDAENKKAILDLKGKLIEQIKISNQLSNIIFKELMG